MKFFVFGDTHSFYDEFIEALEKAGYDEENSEHWLIGLGDYFDRGEKSQEMYDFLMAHQERCALVRGNHEDLMRDMLDRGYYQGHDISNGTVKTVLQLSGNQEKRVTYWGIDGFIPEDWNKACIVTREKLAKLNKRMVNYFETEHYVFTHGFIPTDIEPDENYEGDLPLVYRPYKTIYNEDWRYSHQWEWEEARWENGMKWARYGIRIPDKTLVVGHFHTSWGHALDTYKKNDELGIEGDFEDYEFGDKADFSPYYCDGLIAIDACTAHSGKVNILVLEDDLLREI